MKTAPQDARLRRPPPIVRLAEAPRHDADGEAEAAQVARARAFAEPLLAGQMLDTGEDALAHADGVAAILQGIGAAPAMRAAAYLVYAGDYLQQARGGRGQGLRRVATRAWSAHTRKLVQIQRAAREAQVGAEQRAEQTERVRKMLLAFSRDLRVVLLRLASRLQTLRFHAASKLACPPARGGRVAAGVRAAGQPAGHLADQVGDRGPVVPLPRAGSTTSRSPRLLDEKRVEREQRRRGLPRANSARRCARRACRPRCRAGPKHLYSIWKKMQRQGAGLRAACSTCARCA